MTASLEYITSPTVFRHKKREEWGIGRVMSEGPYRRRIQFEDGQRRTFKRDYYHLLERVENPNPEAKATLDTLVDAARAEMGARATKSRRPSRVNATEALAAQVKAFREDYPHGFQDPKWKADVRGVGATRHLKRHRDTIAEQGPALLGNERLRANIEADGASAVFDKVLELLRSTDLAVLKTDVKPLEKVGDAARAELLEALIAAREGDGTARYDELLALLERHGVKPTWTLVSTLLTLTDPTAQGPVKSATIRKQGKRLGLAATLPNRPSGQGHQNAQDVLTTVRTRLADLDLHPVDMLDVADFIAHTVSKV